MNNKLELGQITCSSFPLLFLTQTSSTNFVQEREMRRFEWDVYPMLTEEIIFLSRNPAIFLVNRFFFFLLVSSPRFFAKFLLRHYSSKVKNDKKKLKELLMGHPRMDLQLWQSCARHVVELDNLEHCIIPLQHILKKVNKSGQEEVRLKERLEMLTFYFEHGAMPSFRKIQAEPHTELLKHCLVLSDKDHVEYPQRLLFRAIKQNWDFTSFCFLIHGRHLLAEELWTKAMTLAVAGGNSKLVKAMLESGIIPSTETIREMSHLFNASDATTF